MFSTSTRFVVRTMASVHRGNAAALGWRLKSSSAVDDVSDSYGFDKNGETTEYISFPTAGDKNQPENMPILLNAQEHAVGYLSKILNARVYEAAIETELQEAKNLSSVCRMEMWFLSTHPIVLIIILIRPFFCDSI